MLHKAQFTRGTKMHNAALQPHGCAQINARRVHMLCLIMHAFQYLSCLKKRSDVTPSSHDRWMPTDCRDPNNTVQFHARAVRHAAQIKALAYSRLSQCLVHEQALNHPVFHASCNIVHFLMPHVNWP